MTADASRHPLAALAGRRVSPVALLGFAFVAIIVFWLIVNLAKDPADFFEVTAIGMTNGCVYALVALGYTLVYGILELINFAHGDVFMIGGMISGTMIVSSNVFGLAAGASTGSLVPALLGTLAVAMLACGLLNATIERIAYR